MSVREVIRCGVVVWDSRTVVKTHPEENGWVIREKTETNNEFRVGTSTRLNQNNKPKCY